jgi:hypothetical protein
MNEVMASTASGNYSCCCSTDWSAYKLGTHVKIASDSVLAAFDFALDF